MMRSLYSGISGLRNHQTRMDVIGNNIANVNTVGYKTSRTTFQDIFSQTAAGGTANLGFIGGTNPMQIGLGIKLATIDVLHTPAPMARTDNPFDMMIEGDGYFVVETEADTGNYLYTRAGNFYLDNEGYLVTSHGYYVMGFGIEMEVIERTDEDDQPYVPPQYTVVPIDPVEDEEPWLDLEYSSTPQRIRLRVPTEDDTIYNPDAGPDDDNGPPFIDLVGFSVGQDGSVSVIVDNRKVTIAFLSVAMFSNPAGLEKTGNSLYREGPASGGAVIAQALENGAGRVNGGGLEMSNVDLATEFTDMIVTQRGFQANSRIITVSDTMLEELVNLKR